MNEGTVQLNAWKYELYWCEIWTIDVWGSPVLGTVRAADAALRLSYNLDLRPGSVGVWLSHSAHIISTLAQ